MPLLPQRTAERRAPQQSKNGLLAPGRAKAIYKALPDPGFYKDFSQELFIGGVK